MNLLLVEDDEYKRAALAAFIRRTKPSANVTEARSFHSALLAMQDAKFDRIILDMSLPSYDNERLSRAGRPQAYGGWDLLGYLSYHERGIPTLVVTQFDRFGEGESALTFDQLNESLRKEFQPAYHGAVFYSVDDDAWQSAVARFLQD